MAFGDSPVQKNHHTDCVKVEVKEEPVQVADGVAAAAIDEPVKVITPAELTKRIILLFDAIQKSFTTAEERRLVAAVPTLLRLANWDLDTFAENLRFVETLDDKKPTLEHAIRTLHKIELDTTNSVNKFGFKGQCIDCLERKDIVTLDCQHGLCLSCWDIHIAEFLEDHKLDIVCHRDYCKVVMADHHVRALITPATLKLYRRELNASYIDHNKSLVPCETAGCETIFDMTTSQQQSMRSLHCSKCGGITCPLCKQAAHPLVACEQLETWRQKVLKEAADLLAVQLCTGCNFPLEQADPSDTFPGCHRCRLLSCWGCGEQLREGGYLDHNCQIFADDATLPATSTERRFLICLQNWMVNRLKEKEAGELYSKFRDMVVDPVVTRISPKPYHELTESMKSLLQLRRVLSCAWMRLFDIREEKKARQWIAKIMELSRRLDNLAHTLSTELSINSLDNELNITQLAAGIGSHLTDLQRHHQEMIALDKMEPK